MTPQGRAFQLDPMGAVNDAVEDRITERGIGDHLVPFTDRDLAGDQQRAALVAIVDDLEQIAALLGIERLRPPIVDDQQPDAFERGQQPRRSPEPILSRSAAIATGSSPRLLAASTANRQRLGSSTKAAAKSP